MSGLEVPGVVLATIPLVVSVLEHHEDLFRPTKEFIQWRVHKNRLVNELVSLHSSFHYATEQLLKPITTPDVLHYMVNNPRCELWTKGPVADELRETLGVLYVSLLINVREVNEILVAICEHLRIDGAQLVFGSGDTIDAKIAMLQVTQPRHTFEMSRRVAFTMAKKDIKRNLVRLELCNTRVSSWAQLAGQIQEGQSQKQSTLKFAGSLENIQQNATRLYHTLSRSWCKVMSLHPTFLLLEQRLRRSRARRKDVHDTTNSSVAEPSCFKLSIRGECSPETPQFNTEIRICDIELRSPDTPRIRIDSVHDCTSPDDPPYMNPAALPQVDEFCETIRAPTNSSLGFCIDGKEDLRSYLAENSKVPYVNGCITLEALLAGPQARLPLEGQYSLAITIVSSVLQLSHTPWLEGSWDKRNIGFLRASRTASSTVDIKYPYLMQDFASREEKITDFDSLTLLSLAIVLLELSSGKPIEQVREPEDQGNRQIYDESARFHTAKRWLREEKEKDLLSYGFYTAILNGLQEHVNPLADLTDRKYCDFLKEKMLQPLEDEMQSLVFGPYR